VSQVQILSPRPLKILIFPPQDDAGFQAQPQLGSNLGSSFSCVRLVEGLELGDFQARQDDIASMLEVRLKPHPGLKTGRLLKFDINVVTYAPARQTLPETQAPYVLATRSDLLNHVRGFKWSAPDGVYKNLVAAVQVVTSIRAGKQRREPKKPDSRGAKLKRVEESIANLPRPVPVTGSHRDR
jgi:hypothetical protein